MNLILNRMMSLASDLLTWFIEGVRHLVFLFTNYMNTVVIFQGLEGPAILFTSCARWIFPFLALAILLRCVIPLLHSDGYDKVWGFLDIPNGDSIPVKHWENSIGRSRLSDIVINLPYISRSHAVLSYDGRRWHLTDLSSKAGVKVNGEKLEGTKEVEYGDIISLAELDFFLLPAVTQQKSLPTRGFLGWVSRLQSQYAFASYKTFALIILFQIFACIQISLTLDKDQALLLSLWGGFVIFIVGEILLYMFLIRYGNKYVELELVAFFLCGINLFIVSAVSPSLIYKQLLAMLIGLFAYFFIGFAIQNPLRSRIFKYTLVCGAAVLIILNLSIGSTRFGAQNWIDLGFITFQPMEFVKVAFVMAGTASLDKLLTSRNLYAFIGFSGICIFTLVIIRDFGMALVFFFAFIIIAFMRSGDYRTIALIASGAGLAAFAVIRFMPYIAARFRAWGHVWEYADSIGYQQTRTMIAVASGGLLGVGGGNGKLLQIGAADTDLVFGVLCEEWGFIIGLTVILSIVFLPILAVFLTKMSRSSLYSIAACGATSFFLIQTALNVFGSLDILPLTGITLPFVSNGGSSMISSWALLAFVRAADERGRRQLNETID